MNRLVRPFRRLTPVFRIWLVAMLAMTTVPATSSAARAAGPWYVAPSGNDSNDCLTTSTPCATINGAIGKASSGDTIYVATGTYTNSTGSEVVLIDKDITLSGGWDETFTAQSSMSTIDGEKARQGIVINSGAIVTVERFTVQEAEGERYGISNAGTLTLNGIYIHSNGLGINSTGALTLTNSAVTDNGSTASCGLAIYSTGDLILNNITVSGNETGNPVYCSGPVIVNSGGTLLLNNTTVSANSGGNSNGLASNPPATLRNSLIAGNTSSSGTLSDCPIGTVLNSLGYNFIGAAGCTITATVGDQIGSPTAPIEPKLEPLIGAPAYHPLRSDSPAIDAGNPAGCMGSAGLLTTDQRGALRVGTCDIGAYEYTIPGPAVSIYASGGTPQRTPPFSIFGTPLQAVVLDSVGTPVNNATVTFTAPSSGASGTFADSGTVSTTAVTDGNDLAVAPAFAANSITGTYTVTATVSGVITPANFALTNFGWYATTNGNDTNDCQTPATPCATISGVLGKPNFVAGDTALVAGGTYIGTGEQVALIDKSVRVVGDWNSTFTLQDSLTVIDGEGARMGIMVINYGVTAIIERFAVQNGSTTGIFLNQATLTLNSSTISRNTGSSGYAGYGIHTEPVSHLTLNNSNISGNAAWGIDNGTWSGSSGGSTVILNNSTVSGNMDGGIINAGILILNNSTISKNIADYGAGIYNAYGTTTLRNSLLAGNTTLGAGPDCNGTLISQGYNLIQNTTGCTFTATTGDLLNVDPLLWSTLVGSPGYHPLLVGSPAIDAGNPTGCTDHLGNLLSTDQRGAARPVDGNGDNNPICDIGAYEFDPNNNPLRQVFLPLIYKDYPLITSEVWYVSPTGGDANTCITPATACASINGVLGKSGFQPSNSIRVAAGTYMGSGLQVAYFNKSAALSGGWDSVFTTQNGTTIVDGQNARRGVLVEYGATVTLDRFVVQNGRVVAPFYYGQGGGILNYGTLTVTNSTVSNNFVGGTEFGEGAGIFNGGTLTIINSTISGNTSTGTSNDGRGGGIQNYGSGASLTLNNVTISNNTSDVAGGLFIFGAVTTTVQNSLIAGNTTTTGFLIDCEGALLSLGYTLIGSTSGCGFTSGPGDLLNVSPNLGPLQDNGGNTFTHALLLGSPAIDAANPATPGSGGTTCAATDQRGVVRPQGVRCDMGAYEYSP